MRTLTQNLFLTLVAATVLAAPTAIAGGTIVKSEGAVAVERKGKEFPAGESFPVWSGDTLSVAEHGRAQLLFEDDSVFAVAGGSKLRVNEFTLPKGTAGGKAIYTLEQGGFRTVTGRVGKGPADVYEVRTDVASIKVAGSAYSALRCKGCGAKYKNGLYVKAESGVIMVANSGGELRLRVGQTAFVEGQASAPVSVAISPFSDPAIVAAYSIDAQFDTQVHPPRVEPEPPSSP